MSGGNCTAWFAAYFGGSIYYVKTLIRDFGDKTRFAQSVSFHAALFVGAVVLAVAQPHLAGGGSQRIVAGAKLRHPKVRAKTRERTGPNTWA